jgi:hypothetical protein
MGAFNGEVATVIAQMLCGRHVAAYYMLQRILPAGFVAPGLPTKTDKLPSGSQWLHEIKHDGFRVIARKNGAQVRLYSRPGSLRRDRRRFVQSRSLPPPPPFAIADQARA